MDGDSDVVVVLTHRRTCTAGRAGGILCGRGEKNLGGGTLLLLATVVTIGAAGASTDQRRITFWVAIELSVKVFVLFDRCAQQKATIVSRPF